MLKTALGMSLFLGSLNLVVGQVPLEVFQGPVTAAGGGAVVTLRLSNKSGKAIVAYGLATDLLDESGKRVFQRRTVFVRGLVPGAPTAFVPGENWTGSMNIPSHDGKPAAPTVTVDYVLFADRSSWGPDKLHTSERIAGMILATRGERTRLKKVLRERGAAAVADDLKLSP